MECVVDTVLAKGKMVDFVLKQAVKEQCLKAKILVVERLNFQSLVIVE